MKSIMWPVSCAFGYPEKGTLGGLESRLEGVAAEWRGWQGFPWRVTRNLHRYLGRPPVNFHYLMVHRCLAGYAAHIALTSTFVNRRAVLTMLHRDRFEFIGVMRKLLLDAIRTEMHKTRNSYILDCSGPENRHMNVPTKDIELRRVTFRENMEWATDDFISVLDLASHIDDPTERIFNHSLLFWKCGADMPPDAVLEVQAEETATGIVLTPCRSEVVAFLRARKPVPRILLRHGEWEAVTGTRFEETAGLPPPARDLTIRELCTHLDGRLDNLGREQAGLLQENTSLKENIATVLAGAARQVEPDYFRMLFVVLGTGSVSGGAKALKIPNSTLGGRLRAYAAKGGLYKTLFDTIDVRRKLGAKSVERFNESFAGHQGRNCDNEEALRDLLDGLEAMNAGNWGAVRDELLDLVKAGTP